MRSYYDVLGVRRDASSEEIKRAYRELARRDHPDRNPGSAAAEEAFKELSAAYSILSDPGSRILYDVYGPADPRLPNGRVQGGTTTAALYLSPAEMAAGCIKVLPSPCSLCGGQGWDVGRACPACGGRGWTPLAPRVRIEVPAGVAAGDTLWGQVLSSEAADPVPFTVRLRGETRTTVSGSGRGAVADAAPHVGNGAAGHSELRPRPKGAAESPRTAYAFHVRPMAESSGALRAIRSVRSHAEAAAERVRERLAASAHTFWQAPPLPVALQLAAATRALEDLGERQVRELDAATRRFSADVNRLRSLLAIGSSSASQPWRVADVVREGWAGQRLAVLAGAGALLVGLLATWLIGSAIAALGLATDLLPAPLSAVRRGWTVGAGLAGLTLLAGVARVLLREYDSRDGKGLILESLPYVLLVSVLALTARMFWLAEPSWLQRLAAARAAVDPLHRAAVAITGGVLMLVLYGLGEWSALGIARAARARARLRADALLADRERRLESARALAARVREQADAIGRAANDFPAALRGDFERAAGIPANGSVAEDVGRVVQSLLQGNTPPRPSRLPGASAGAIARLGRDLLAAAAWATGGFLLFSALAPAVPGWAVRGSARLGALAALAVPLAATLAALFVKDGWKRRSRSALLRRTLPSPSTHAAVYLGVAAVLVLAICAAAIRAAHPPAVGAGWLAGFWTGALVLGVAGAALNLDGAFVAAMRLAKLGALAVAWAAVRAAGACARLGEAALTS